MTDSKTADKNASHPLRDAKLIVQGHRKDDGQHVAVFETSEGETVEYEVHAGKPPVRPAEDVKNAVALATMQADPVANGQALVAQLRNNPEQMFDFAAWVAEQVWHALTEHRDIVDLDINEAVRRSGIGQDFVDRAKAEFAWRP